MSTAGNQNQALSQLETGIQKGLSGDQILKEMQVTYHREKEQEIFMRLQSQQMRCLKELTQLLVDRQYENLNYGDAISQKQAVLSPNSHGSGSHSKASGHQTSSEHLNNQKSLSEIVGLSQKQYQKQENNSESFEKLNNLANSKVILKLQNGFKNKANKCGHRNRRSYANGLCITCFYKTGAASKQQRSKQKKAWLCQHTEKLHYSKGFCKNCYLTKYYRDRKAKFQMEQMQAQQKEPQSIDTPQV